MNWSGKSDEHSEKGAIIVFVMLLILGLIFIVAVAIDGSRGLIEQGQTKLVSDQIALAALEAYTIPDGLSHADRFDQAIARAADIGGQNVSMMRNGSYVGTEAELRAHTSGVVTSGRWWNTRPPVCGVATCPCGLTPTTQAPCFQACPDTGVCPQVTGRDSDLANAMQVTLRTTAANPLRAMFSGAITTHDIDVTNTSTASTQGSIAIVAPRLRLILLDLSRRTTFESDPPFVAPPAGPPPPPPGPHHGDAVPDSSCAAYAAEIPPPPSFAPLLCADLGTPPKPYFVHPNKDSQPFGQELDAVNGALRSFKDNALPNDRIGLIGFSDSLPSHPTKTILPVDVSDPMLDTMLKMTNTVDDLDYGLAVTSRAMRNAAGLVPFGNSHADIAGALNTARATLETLNSLPGVEKVITLVTQGVPDCNRSPTCSAATDTACFDPPSGPTLPAEFTRQESQLKQILRLCGAEILDRLNARIDVALTGAQVMPHTLLLRSAYSGILDTGCMQEFELRKRNYLNVKPLSGPITAEKARFDSLGDWGTLPLTAPGTAQPTASYLLPDLYFYTLTRLTRGFWQPIRAACPPFPPAVPDLNSACVAGVRPPLSLVIEENTWSKVVLNGSLQVAGIEDNEGRILCDDKYRTAVKQMRDQFDTDFTRRAFILTN